MELDDALGQYQAIAREVWPHVAQDAADGPHHPVRYLLTSDASAAQHVAYRTDKALAILRERDPQWLDSKAARLGNDREHSAVVSMLGEVRAYSSLLSCFRSAVTPSCTGADFSVSLSGQTCGVEVYSPWHRSARSTAEPERSDRYGLRMELVEVAPFGLPERRIDNVQGEAVSRLAQAKRDERQFRDYDVAVLWLDFQDPHLWGLVPDLGQAKPFITFRNSATSGAFWSAFYGRRGLPVFDSLSFESGDHSVYRMEFDGRFYQPTALGLAVISLIGGTVVYENPNLDSRLPEALYRALHILPEAKPELCWLDWPKQGSLVDRVESARSTIEAYATAFECR